MMTVRLSTTKVDVGEGVKMSTLFDFESLLFTGETRFGILSILIWS